MRVLKVFGLLVASSLPCFPAFSQEITQITWATPVWEDLTNKDGSGIYHEVIAAIYGRAGIKVVVKYVPWARAMAEVEKGEADFSGGDSPTDKYAQPKTPIFRNVELAFFKKTTIPSYSGVADLDKKRGVWVRGYTDNFPDDIKRHIKGVENNTREGALGMVLLNRADYFLNNDAQLPQTLRAYEGKYNPDEYTTGLVYVEDLLLCFTKSPRGQRLAEMFDQGMKRLAAAGELKKIYTKWHRNPPPVK